MPCRASRVMAVVDFTKPSSDKRLDVVDLSNGTLIGQYYVAHGSGSGGRYATRFSNTPNSHESSLGVFAVGQTSIMSSHFCRPMDYSDIAPTYVFHAGFLGEFLHIFFRTFVFRPGM